MKKVLLLEDDFFQAEALLEDLQQRFASFQIMAIKTEHEFRTHLENPAFEPPILAILDVMARWTDPAPQMPEAPNDVKQEGYHRAGIRCAKLLRIKYPKLPIILYSVLEKADLSETQIFDEHMSFVEKDATSIRLIEKIKEFVGTR